MGVLKASDADKEHFRPALSDHIEVIIKPMFGTLGAFGRSQRLPSPGPKGRRLGQDNIHEF